MHFWYLHEADQKKQNSFNFGSFVALHVFHFIYPIHYSNHNIFLNTTFLISIYCIAVILFSYPTYQLCKLKKKKP